LIETARVKVQSSSLGNTRDEMESSR
jgi:hypothetical protein